MDNALIDHPTVDPDRDATRGTSATDRAPARRRIDFRGLVLVGILLGASGGYRYWRDHQFSSLEAMSRQSPFALKELSTVQGNWRMVEGAEATLDPRIARVAGSTDHVVRTYQNEETGEKATVLAIYGPAQLVFGHTPEVCYPSAGYKPLAEPTDETIPGVDGGPDALYRQARYGWFEGGASRISEVYYTFRNGGIWTPDMASRWKQFRYNPGMFKLQVERTAGGSDAEIKKLLAALAADVEERLRSTPDPD